MTSRVMVFHSPEARPYATPPKSFHKVGLEPGEEPGTRDRDRGPGTGEDQGPGRTRDQGKPGPGASWPASIAAGRRQQTPLPLGGGERCEERPSGRTSSARHTGKPKPGPETRDPDQANPDPIPETRTRDPRPENRTETWDPRNLKPRNPDPKPEGVGRGGTYTSPRLQPRSRPHF